MSKQPNKTLIGAFIVGAVVLVVAGVLISKEPSWKTSLSDKHVG